MGVGHQVFLVLYIVYCALGILGIRSLGIRAYALDATSRATAKIYWSPKVHLQSSSCGTVLQSQHSDEHLTFLRPQ